MLTLSDKPLIVLTPEASEWISQNISTSSLTTWLTRSWPGPGLTSLSWTTGYYVPRRIEINKLVWPGGASRWGYFYGLTDESTLKDLLPISYPERGCQSTSLTLNIDSLPPTDPAYELLSPTVYLLTPIPLSNVVYVAPNTNPFLPPQVPNLPSNINNLFLLPLVDQRYFWWQQNTQVVNIPSDGLDWQTLFDQMAAILGISITVDSPVSDYLQANPSLNLDYQPLAPYLDALAYNIGQRIYLDINTNQVFSQNYDNARNARQTSNLRAVSRTVRAGWYWYLNELNLDATQTGIDEPQLGYGESNVLPVEVIVTFPAKACPPRRFCPEGFPRWYTKTVTALEAASGCTCASGFAGQLALRDQAFALFGSTMGPPDNQSNIDGLAIQLARDFYNWRCFRYDMVYNGIIAPTLDATIDLFEVGYTTDDQYTRLMSAPLNGEADEFHHIDQTCEVPTPVVYVPLAHRQGNHLIIPKARLVEDNQGKLMLCTSSYDSINICVPKCTSHSTSSQSDVCPTTECQGCMGAANCCFIFQVQGIVGSDLSCAGLNLLYYLSHVSGCTWFAPQGTTQMLQPAPGFTATLTFGSGGWTLTVMGGGHVAVFQDNCIGSGPWNCTQVGGFTFCITSIDSACIASLPNATATVINTAPDHCVQPGS